MDSSIACRACLINVSRVHEMYINLQSIVDSYSTHKEWSYQELYEAFTGYTVLDHEPQELCETCAMDLVKAFQFKSKCQESQRVLQLKVPTVEVIEVKVEPDEMEGLSAERMDDEEFSSQKQQVFDDEDENDDDSDSDDREIVEQKPRLRKKFSSGNKILKRLKYHCEYCETSYKDRWSLNQHFKAVHSDKKSHACSNCQAMFFTNNLLESHLKNCKKNRQSSEDHEKRLYICPVCGKLCSNKHIQYHTQRHAKQDNPSSNTSSTKTEKDPQTFICDMCGVTVTSRFSMVNHMRVIHFNQRTKCKHCDATFRSPSYLATHVRKIHLQESPLYKCGKCDYIASSDTYLKRHRMIHSGKEPLKCTMCDYECYTKWSLNNHLASHSDARPYTCEICAAAFKTKKALRNHKKTHGEYDYECPVCKKGFFSNHLMRAHAKKMHPDYSLPPPGTVFSKTALKKMAEKELQEMAMRSGTDIKQNDEIVQA